MLPKRLKEPFAWVEHIPFAFHLVKLCKPNQYVELGVHIGNSFSAVCQAVKHYGLKTKCFGVDNWTGDVHAGFYAESIYEDLKIYVDEHYAELATLLRMSFDTGRNSFADGSIDLLHIDGLHTYEAVKKDFETWLPKMSERGVIMFHDTAVRTTDFGVWQLWEEVASKYPSFEFKYGFGLGIIAVGSSASPELLSFLTQARADASYHALFARLGASVLWRAEREKSDKELSASHERLLAEEEKLNRYRQKLVDANLAEQYVAEMSFDRGAESPAELSQRKEITGREAELIFSIPPGAERVRLATFKPFEGPVALRISEIEVLDAAGARTIVKDFAANHFFVENGVYLFDTDKPKVTFTLHSIEQPVEVRISLSYVAFGPTLFALLYKLLLQTLDAQRFGLEVRENALVVHSIDTPNRMPPREKKSYDAEMLDATLFLHEEVRKKDALISEQKKELSALLEGYQALLARVQALQESEKAYLDVIQDRDEHFRNLERAFEDQTKVIEDRDKHFKLLETHMRATSQDYEARLAEQKADLNEARGLAQEILTQSEPRPELHPNLFEKWRRIFQKSEGDSPK